MNSTEEIYFLKAQEFVTYLLNEVGTKNIDPRLWDIDHLCFRTKSIEHYESVKSDFAKFSQLLIESPVNGRPIATYKIKSPWMFGDHFIDLVEIPAPKPNKETKPGFEHIEVVMSHSFHDIQKMYPEFKFEKNDHHKKFNPELVANFSCGDIKFHHQSLEVIINIEKNEFLKVAGFVLEHFNLPFFITGTYPICLEIENSDVDVCLTYTNKADILQKIESLQSRLNSPVININNDVITLQLNIAEKKYEFYFTKVELYKQNAYRHLNIETRLLKIFGGSLKQKVLKEKIAGLNTELAFLNSLNIQSDIKNCFNDILKLNNLSDFEIYKKYQ